MRTRTTYILLALTLGLGAWMIFRGGSGPSDLGGHLLFDWSNRTLQTGTISVDVNPAEVTGIDLKNSSVTISVRKDATGEWELTGGIKDRADSKLVAELLNYCGKARIREVLPGSELKSGKLSPEALGLDDAGAWQVRWLKADGSVAAEVITGKTAPVENTSYVRVTGRGQESRPDVYLVEPDLRPLLARPVDSFRDPQVSRYESTEVQRLLVRKGEGEVEFSRASVKEEDAAPWVISKPLPNAPAEQPVVKDLVAVICGAQIKGWVPFTEGAGAEGGDKPLVEVTLVPAGADAKGVTLSFFNDPETPDKTAICRDVQRRAAFKVEKAVVENLLIADTPDNFRSLKLGSVDPAVISTVEISSLFGDSVLVVRVGDKWSWRLLGGGPWSEAAPEQLDKLFARINSTEIVSYASDSLADPAVYGLDKPAFTIKMAKGAHLSLEQLTPMTPKNTQELRIGIRPPPEGDGRIFANFAGEPFVYQIGPNLPQAVPLSAIKWRSLTLPGFSVRQVRAFKQTVGAAPPLELSYDPLSFQWTGKQAGADITSRLNKAAAETLAARAGGMVVTMWLSETADAFKALENPAVVIELEIDSYEEKPSVTVRKTITLELAPIPTGANAGFCFGRISGVAEPFLIDSRVLHDMKTTLLL